MPTSALKNSTPSVVLDAIRRAKRIARIDLAKTTDISQATVTTVTADLITLGLIEEVAPTQIKGKSPRGRPRVDLKLRSDAFLVAGLKIAETSISVVLVDFEGTVLHKHRHSRSQTRAHVDHLGDEVKTAIDDMLDGIDCDITDLSAIGVGMAGVVDATRGFVHWSPALQERNIDLATQLSDKMQLPVFLDNDANLVAMAEQYLGSAQNVANFIVVTIEMGVGMGIVIDHRLYRGARGCGAEFGHTKVQLDGALCRCGQRGCLEAYVADYALLREAAFDTSTLKEASTEQRVQELLAAARAGDPTAHSIVNRSSRVFAMGLANLVNLFDPQLIILSGERMTFDHLYANDVMAAIKSSIVQVDAPPPEIVIHKWGDFMWARGAAAFALIEISEQSLNSAATQTG